eukprot:CAMPEP_0178474510 /NCGR_PEP_ID=MMETSP0696-20121128/2637_1 /TAXON_ID=265572 /ORGANISM="Extubocellulus spinifer, Strain CCMP396" /LENGTH=267 /DNA_ID=CAMNT_0020101761 /DNA_START=61 /DNA_END=866 /DNA_ORIENTATION=-
MKTFDAEQDKIQLTPQLLVDLLDTLGTSTSRSTPDIPQSYYTPAVTAFVVTDIAGFFLLFATLKLSRFINAFTVTAAEKVQGRSLIARIAVTNTLRVSTTEIVVESGQQNLKMATPVSVGVIQSVGPFEGASLGDSEGVPDGSTEGISVGDVLGAMLSDGAVDTDGSIDGSELLLGSELKLGDPDGVLLGCLDGSDDGLVEGINEGEALVDGLLEGNSDGDKLGSSEGSKDGIELGPLDGLLEGRREELGFIDGLGDRVTVVGGFEG